VYPLKFFGIILYPATRSLSELSRLLMSVFHREGGDARVKMTAEELLFHLQDSREAGLIPKDTLALAAKAFDLMGLKAKDVMLPINEVNMVEEGLDLNAYQKVFVETRFTRLPVYRVDRANVVGILSIQNLLKGHGPLVDAPVLENVYDVATETPISEILIRMKNQGCHMAMIRDDKDKLVGMTTLEDILERLVGAISDEFH
jgi:putative hemolysin